MEPLPWKHDREGAVADQHPTTADITRSPAQTVVQGIAYRTRTHAAWPHEPDSAPDGRVPPPVSGCSPGESTRARSAAAWASRTTPRDADKHPCARNGRCNSAGRRATPTPTCLPAGTDPPTTDGSGP